MKNILVVDDSDYILGMLKMLLENESQSVDIALNGSEATGLLEFKKFDLIITDMMMPVMNGRQLVKYVRECYKYKDVPIILFSGYLDVNSVKDLLEEGVTYFLPKPVSITVLQDYVGRCLK